MIDYPSPISRHKYKHTQSGGGGRERDKDKEKLPTLNGISSFYIYTYVYGCNKEGVMNLRASGETGIEEVMG